MQNYFRLQCVDGIDRLEGASWMLKDKFYHHKFSFSRYEGDERDFLLYSIRGW